MPLRVIVIGIVLLLPLSADANRGLRGDAAPRLGSFIQAAPVGKDGMWIRPDEPGVWLAWEQACTGVTGPLLAAWEKQLKDIAALIRACPVFKDIRGYYPMLTGCVEGPGGAAGPYGGTVHFLIWPPMTVERMPAGEPRVKKEWRYNHPGGISLMPRVNAYGDLAFSWAHYEDRDGRFYELPETSREIAGFPVIGGFLFLTASGKPPLFTPITRERALRWLAGNIRRQAGADASMLASARRRYRGLHQSRRTGQAHDGDRSGRGDAEDAREPGGREAPVADHRPAAGTGSEVGRNPEARQSRGAYHREAEPARIAPRLHVSRGTATACVVERAR